MLEYPITQLCDSTIGNPAEIGTGFCKAINPPGFYAVLYFDASLSNPFRIYTRAATDFSSTTLFNVFTTTGYLQLVNYNSAAFTTTAKNTATEKSASVYPTTLHFTNYTSYFPLYDGSIDCESNEYYIGSNGLVSCVSKEDYVMILSTSILQTNARQNANPIYPNIYQVKKIGKLGKSDATDPNVPENLIFLELDYALNSAFNYFGGNFSTADTSGHVYKFYPPSNGYTYVAPCSNRGICNHDTGLCECFSGYTSDSCSVINALAH
jgi:hypothetical protein